MDSPSLSAFAHLGLSPPLLEAVRRAKYTRPTPVQEAAIPPALAGQDVIGCAATGTGKTAAFLLPLIDRLTGQAGTRALILAPTRELVLQIAEQLRRFGAALRVRGAFIIGGMPMEAQTRALRAEPEVILATPGRLVDHLEHGTVDLSQIEILVLDEADRMLDMGFRPQLTRILGQLPRPRQTLLFSATMAGEVADFAQRNLQRPVRVEISKSGTTAERAAQVVYAISQLEKTALLLALLAESSETTLVFTRTKRRAEKLAKAVERTGHGVARLHADRSQAQRKHALSGFKGGKYRVLIATDIAARGIDVDKIGHVVNYDVPFVPEDYVHRVGRTARAAASGRASTFVAPEEAGLLRDIEALIHSPLPRAQVPMEAPAFRAELERARAAQRDPGPPQPRPASSVAPAQDRPLGRHARTHPKRPKLPPTT